MEIYIGTSGWLYDWNEEATLDWYVRESGLNAVELNASFYRFPYRNQVGNWLIKGRGLKWSIKVHRSITHMRKLNIKALDTWMKFRDLFKLMDEIIDFYLFQLPPSYKCREENLRRIENFREKIDIDLRMAVEFRHRSCFSEKIVEWAELNNIVLVSIDAPIATWITVARDIVYLRLHGRRVWYGYEYSESELKSIAMNILKLNPRKIYVFFNNDHWMLSNARYMKKILYEGL